MKKIGTGLLLFIGFFVGTLLLNNCSIDRDLGSKPNLDATGTGIIPDDLNGLDSNATWVGGQLRLQVNPPILKANFEDQAEVKVLLYDDSHNPVVGKTVSFASTRGVIEGSSITDSNGTAQVQFTSEPVEADVWVVASIENSAGETVTVGKTIRIAGLSLTLTPQAEDVLIHSQVSVAVELLDASGNPLSDQKVALTGGISKTLTTDGSGRANFSVTRSSQDSAVILATVLGVTVSKTIRFWTTVPEGSGSQVSAVRSMRIFASRSQLRADNSDQTTITVILMNERNNPASGDTVFFASNLGVIGALGIVDSTGRATVTLHSAPVVGKCTVRASANAESVKDSLTVDFTGLSLRLQSTVSGAPVDQFVEVEAELQDASDNAIGGDQIVFRAEGGTFENGTGLFTTALDADGKAKARVTASDPGVVSVKATALNASDSIRVAFTRNNLTVTASKSYVTVGGMDSITLTANYVDATGSPLVGSIIAFYSNAGVVRATATTDAQGNASVVYKGPAFSGSGTVQVVAQSGSSSIVIEVRASIATAVKLSITPDNIGVNGGVAELVAEVTDAQGNLVTDQTVNFRILQGPGAGEAISKVTALTQNGIAKSALNAGSVPSSYQGVLVVADLGNGKADTSKLTISGLPEIVTVSRPEDDTVVVLGAGSRDESIFQYFVGAVVQDVNGNPVADGSVVHFSAYVSGMTVHTRYLVEWAGVNGATELKAVLGYRNVEVPFEDINNNLTMDPSIDLKLDFNNAVARRGDDANGDGVVDYDPNVHDFWMDFNGNGICDPGVGEPRYDSVAYPSVYADLDRNGVLTRSELKVDHDGDGLCDLPASGDFRYWLWEMLPYWSGVNFDFDHNDFAVVIAVSAVTKDGVAKAALTYPRQLARRLMVSVGAESNGVRDRDGERFALPVIVGE